MTEITLSDGERELVLTNPPDGIYLTDWNAPIPARENVYAQGADAEGRTRVRTTTANPEGSGRVRVDQSAGDDVDLHDDLDDFQDLVESAHRSKGWIRMAPDGGEAVTFDLESIRISEFVLDDERRRLVECAFEFETRPYGRLDPVEIFAGEAFGGPQATRTVDLSNLAAHADLFAELTLTDDSSVASDLIEVGYELEDDAAADPFDTMIESADLLIADYAGDLATRSGAFSGVTDNVVRGTLTTTPSALCAWSGTHLGRKKIRARVYASDVTVLVRLAWRIGDGPIIREPWVTVPVEDAFWDAPLATIEIPEAAAGAHFWIGYIEAKSLTDLPTLDIDYVEVIPAHVYGRAGGLSVSGFFTGGPIAADDFSTHSAGALSTKTPPLAPSGSWTESGDTDDFQIQTASAIVSRSAVSDANVTNGGQFVRAGSGVADDVVVQADIYVALVYGLAATSVRQGIFARYVDTSNWLMAVYDNKISAATNNAVIRLLKNVAGSLTTLATVDLGSGTSGQWRTIQLVADAAGNVVVYDGPKGGTLTGRALVLADGDLDTGSTLDDGGYGMYDANTTAVPHLRYYDNFLVSEPVANTGLIQHALNADQSIKFMHDTCVREDPAGFGFGRVPEFEGQHLRLPPATLNRKTGRLFVKRRRGNPEAGVADDSAGLSDSLVADLTVTPRVLITGG